MRDKKTFLKIKASAITLGLICAIYTACAQDVGIKFENGLTWQQVQDKAKAEHKFIFMDCYATWCGPCKYMTKNIFPQQVVGDYFNAHFISVAVQFDKTANDAPNIKDWYATTDSIHKVLKISEYPTYLFFSPEGKPLHRSAGATNNAVKFIAIAKDAVDPGKQVYTLLDNWRLHIKDSVYLFRALSAAENYNSMETAHIASAYTASIKDTLTWDNIPLLDPLVLSAEGWWFQYYMSHSNRIDQVMGGNYAEKTLSEVIFKTDFNNSFLKEAPVYWNRIVAETKKKYPGTTDKLIKALEALFKTKVNEDIASYAAKEQISPAGWRMVHQKVKMRFPGYDVNLLVLQAKLRYYEQKKQAKEIAETAGQIISRYGDLIGDRKANDIIFYDIFNQTGDPALLQAAIKQMSRSVERTADCEDYDTYANLLYKCSQLNNAINWENKAIALATASQSILKDKDLKTFQETLEKMNRHEKTWEDNSPVPLFKQ